MRIRHIHFFLCTTLLFLGSCTDLNDTRDVQIKPLPEGEEVEFVQTKFDLERSYDYKLDPYTESLDLVPTIYFLCNKELVSIEQSVGIGEIGATPYDFHPITVDTVFYDSTNYKIRFWVEEFNRLPDFMTSQHLFELYKGFLVVDGKYIYCTYESANQAIELMDRGIIGERFPYIHTVRKLETLAKIAKDLKTTPEMLAIWNPSEVRYGFGVGTKLKVHWHLPQ
jgi:hypothetical protein